MASHCLPTTPSFDLFEMSQSPEFSRSIGRKKKGVRNEACYQVNKIKKARLEGSAYINYKGKEVAAKILGTTCGCKAKCFENLSDDVKQAHFKKSHEFQTKNEKDIYVQSHIENTPIKRRTQTKNPETSKEREFCFKYFVPSKGVKISVCKAAFCMLFDVTREQVRRLQVLLIQNKTPRDLRGKQNNRKRIPSPTTELIKLHIASFPTTTHSGSKKINYLDAQLNIKKMYGFFKQVHGEVAKYSFYFKVFKENFKNYRFDTQVKN